ncbi:interactor of constitutive active ROPs 2, chloroplastic-like [Macadamia integrifolia]|uniref:interactor of constitutive active ROPs 2, chloroplastic-like n=1 Tax=Macadamia integrifolia TaxID=60698 RepID=UPI001C4EC2E7|nr:interactor of constitutive active ROPs 2, chloroplastic-like [Macadamia integrifolia]XP_042512197.1 interactor of constitutive active ROPs 2, chloroplastic-like [Macadamia integrifolia]XP_042512198.1 interactor of constitutive active ROPs 2, chloroplastic-like [Macadamia integrifolia]XP_042512199.1 interactor of constitutive active ROPs 2, chloroplastic-like [Macadamia integrifolia]XP_042512200.1 interactor of constitutive active ROPs 2, chloroplastic-like [Macadamia integrifolia]
MQTPKPRSSSLEVPQRTSPGTPRVARQIKSTGSESDSTSTNPATRTPKDRSPKVIERRSPRSPISGEKKRPSRISELESQLAQLQEDLKKTKDQLTASESWKERAQQEAEEAKKQLLAMSTKLEESQQQLVELSTSEEARVQELCKVSQDRDRAWQSELEAVQQQQSMDSAAVLSAMNEIHRLKIQLEMVAESETVQTKQAETAQSELQRLKIDLAETLSVVENMKVQLKDSKESEAQAQALVSETLLQLETAKTTVEMLRSDTLKAKEAYNNLVLELEQSRAQMNSLEGLVCKLQADRVKASSNHTGDISSDVKSAEEPLDLADSNQRRLELSSANVEVGQLKAALETAETRYQEGQIRWTMQIQSAYELVEQMKSQSCHREAELEAELRKTMGDIEELKANLMDKETELQSILEENEGLNMRIKQTQPSQREDELEVQLQKLKADVSDLKANLMDKETELQSILEENESLKLEINKREMEWSKVNDEAIAEAEAARASEREALMKLGYITEEADKSSRRAARVTEQLEASQAANAEMEAELRRLKVQSDQWRKAAEAAAAVLSTGNNGKFMERSGSLDNYVSGEMGSPYAEDTDDNSPKRKNNMLKKIGVLWKKGQK